ncbi:VHL beta domain-containing protein [Micromonospora sp. NBC_01739]|uniref:VHL beta domain-containing protein n=1 Tax=Micromonospora sp. NBC_01739 TaxID=2975985 RepID=UPI002E0FA2AA|nr:hypothetical protein OIE53_20755 [Micromonospora sp. NBC_01739]
MTQSPDHDDVRRQPRLRIGPWLPDPDSDTMPPAPPATPVRTALSVIPDSADDRPPPLVPEPVVLAVDPISQPTDRRSHRLMLAGVGTAVLGLLLTAFWPTTPSSPTAEPPTPPGRFGWPHAPDLPWSPPGALTPSAPQASSSVAGVSSTCPTAPSRASSPTRSPSPSATRTSPAAPSARPASPSARPSTSPSRTVRPTPSPRPAEPRELTPLPAERERGLRSVSGGPETSIEFVNHRSHPVTVHWLDYQGHRRQYAVLQPSASYRQHTYVGHPWVVTGGRGRALVCFEPTATPARAVVR